MKNNISGKNQIKAIGVMSGTSLDGLDIAAVEFNFKAGKWEYKLCESQTISYSKTWEEHLANAQNLSGEQLRVLDVEYGRYTGKQINSFISRTGFQPDLIASHGHTIFHRPEKGYTLQIGSGIEIALQSNSLTISDFRSTDLALGGQGAPLVPIGDKLLFSGYDYCLNLGGFANISYEENGTRKAFDICPVNFVLNYFARKQGLPYDDGGKLGKNGSVNVALLSELNSLPHYKSKSPRSLGREWVGEAFFPVLDSFKLSEQDKIRTCYEHIAVQITRILSGKGSMLVTGGGAYNDFLINRVKKLTSTTVEIPSGQTIDFKEAIVFAFLGVLRIKNINNCLASVTGAKRDNCGGIISEP